MSDEEPEATGIAEGGGETGGHVLVCELLKGGPRGRGAAQAHCTPPLELSPFSGNMGAWAGLGLGWGPVRKSRDVLLPLHSCIRSAASPLLSHALAIVQSTPGPGPEPDVNSRHLFVWTWGMTWGFASSSVLLR